MQLYRIFSIKDNFLKNCPPEKCKEIAPFFQLQNLFSNLEIKNIYINSNHINSILLDEEALQKIKLLSKLKYNLSPDEQSLKTEALNFDPKKFTQYSVNGTEQVLSIIKEHMEQDHIKRLIKLRKEQQRESVIRKELFKIKS